jgi:hypothetical protein
MSEETKTFHVFGKNSEVKKSRTIVSTFIVYQLSRDDGAIAEYRNVVSVDGKPVGDADKRAQGFFEEIAKVDSSSKELEKLEKEGSRFDQEISLNLFTLYPSVALAENLRSYFEFKLERKEVLEGRELLAVSYRQIRDSPYILTKMKNAPTDGKLTLVYNIDIGENAAARLNGMLWIDPQTFQVWKEERKFTVQAKGFSAPAVVSENILEYQPSDFGILTPRKIVYTQFKIDKKAAAPQKDVDVTFEYQNFTKPNVEVKSGEVKN